MSIISNLFQGLSSKKEQGENTSVEKIMEQIRYKEELAARVHGAELVNKIIDEIIVFVQSSAGESCIRYDGGICIEINEVQYSYHECDYYASDGASYYHGGTYEACGYKEIKDLAFLDEFANYAHQRVKDSINESYIVSKLTCTHTPRYGKGYTRDKYGVSKQNVVGVWHRYEFTIKQPKEKMQVLKDW